MTDTRVEWQGKSEAMFERMLQEVPDPVRDVFRGNLMAILMEKSKEGIIFEDHVVEVVNEKVPEPFKGKILKAFSLMGGIDMNKVGEIIECFPGGQESLIPIFHALQDQFGYCPSEALVLVSQKKGVFLSTLYRLITSYQAFRTEPPKKYMVTVCNGTGCHIKGGGAILKELEKKASENDSQITLEKARCLGCCDFSPALIINGQIYSGSTAQTRVSEILGK